MIKLKIVDRTEQALGVSELKRAVTHATNTSMFKRDLIVEKESNWDELTLRASEIKENVINNLHYYLLETEKKLIDNNVKVKWAANGLEARSIVLDILNEFGIKSVVKAKSMVTEEINLNKALSDSGIEVLETDLGEYIVQIADEKPSHITAPALHKTKRDIALLFQKIHGIDYTENEEELTNFARTHLREKFFQAEAGISGANFICANDGTIVLVENEGNIRYTVSRKKIHIVIAGIEKLLPSFRDVGLFLRVLAPSATGQKFPTYVSFITPDKRVEIGEKKVFVIFLDNGRTDLLKNKKLKEALKCIRCGACMNVCPVYKRVSGHAYNSTYPGPIGSLISPYLESWQSSGDLAFASSLCGRCGEVCPVKINIPHLLTEVRNLSNQENRSFLEKLLFKGFSFLTINSFAYNLTVNLIIKILRVVNLKKILKNNYRDLPEPSKNRFKNLVKSIE